MTSISRIALIASFTLLLSNCLGQKEQTDLNVSGARSGHEWTMRLLSGGQAAEDISPSALLGVHVSQYLTNIALYRGALLGVEAQMTLLYNEDGEVDETYALLIELGSLLEIDLADMLNRNPERRAALDAYVERLTAVGRDAQTQHDFLAQRSDDAKADVRTKKRAASDLDRQLSRALREQDYATAGDLQEQVINAEKMSAEAESREDEINSTIDLYEDLLEIAESRLLAIEQNREALIAGVKVTDMPGVDDIGVLEDAERRNRNSPSLFGPLDN